MRLDMHRPIRRDEMIVEPGGSVRSFGMAADSTSNPCNDCNKREWCVEKRTACEAYRSYTWKHYAKTKELDMLSRVPSKAIFNQIYRGK